MDRLDPKEFRDSEKYQAVDEKERERELPCVSGIFGCTVYASTKRSGTRQEAAHEHDRLARSDAAGLLLKEISDRRKHRRDKYQKVACVESGESSRE